MPYGLYAYNEAGVLQFDTDYPQYCLSSVISLTEQAQYEANYLAGDNHVLVSYPDNVDGRTIGVGTVLKLSSTLRKVYGSLSLNDWPFRTYKMLVFEPFNVVNPAPTQTGAGIECFAANSGMTFSTAAHTLRVKAVHVLPEQNKAQNRLYGSGAGVIDAVSYQWTTAIQATDVRDFGIILATNRTGNLVEYDDSSTIILIDEKVNFSINGNGYLVVTFRGVEGSAIDYGTPYGAVLQWVSYGTQMAYLVDLSAMRSVI